ncbi:hypothetical protein CVT26_009845 [Gymnopilus dilepis]|uniref:Uncharacterized protein n=1 Tax=Gymnopilus dilepis TaxID=231916 RepID=A0A409WCQ5_9AGAR|nr:hypothetical protein CVT26_009845 [Gymnopilus dilepis]
MIPLSTAASNALGNGEGNNVQEESFGMDWRESSNRQRQAWSLDSLPSATFSTLHPDYPVPSLVPPPTCDDAAVDAWCGMLRRTTPTNGLRIKPEVGRCSTPVQESNSRVSRLRKAAVEVRSGCMASDHGFSAPSNVCARRRKRALRKKALQDFVGYHATDPDALPQLERKRLYIHCLEEYIAFLREQYSLLDISLPLMVMDVHSVGLSPHASQVRFFSPHLR